MNHKRIDKDPYLNLGFDVVIGHEGGWQENPADPGNWFRGKLLGTKYGIIARTYFDFYGEEPTKDSMFNLTLDQAKDIYYALFWKRYKCDKITDRAVAIMVFDGVVNYSKTIGLVQQACNLVRKVDIIEDNMMGDNTLAAINEVNPEVIFYAIKAERLGMYENHPNLKNFPGWLSRIKSFYYEDLC